jgi:hypothetical protein
VFYENTIYGFRFSLPETWTGHSTVEERWTSSDGEYSGPVINIRHPLWTSDQPRQDIPIMIFSLDQWEALQKGEFHIGAAPVGPTEIDRNSKYVFALPARYNYGFPEGYQEVEEVLEGRPLEPLEGWEGPEETPTLGGIGLGASQDQVLGILGDRYTETIHQDLGHMIGEDLVVWTFDQGIEVTFGKRSGRAIRVTVQDPDFPTNLGVKVGDHAQTALDNYRDSYQEARSRHYDTVLEGWFLLEEGAVLILDFDASDGSLVNGPIQAGSSIEQIVLAYWEHFD